MFAKAQSLHRQGQWAQATAVYEELLLAQPGHADALHMLGVIAMQTAQPARAVALLGEALKSNPNSALAHYNLGVALQSLGQLESALQSYVCAILHDARYAQAHYNRGVVLQALHRDLESMHAYEQALALQPDHVQAHMNLGNVLRALQRYCAALAHYDAALILQPDAALAHYNRGVTLQDLAQHAQALVCFDSAIAHGARFAGVFNNRGNALLELQRYAQAVQSYDAALQLQPDDVDVHCNRGIALQELRQYGCALQCFDRALALEPGRAFLRGMQLHLKMQLADWTDFDSQVIQLTQAIERGEEVTPAFPVLALCDSNALQATAAAVWMRNKCSVIHAAPLVHSAPRSKKIRVGYFSADFHDHATLFLMAELLEMHDKNRFELFAFSFGTDVQDASRKRVLPVFDAFFDVRAMSDHDIAQLARQQYLDIAVDLKGYSQHSRPAIFAHRAAPVQVNYLGYPGTMAASFMDYIVADKVLVLPQHQAHFSEKIAYLPGSYQPNDRRRPLNDRTCMRQTMGLPKFGFVFCSFNATYKITPESFDGWMRILHKVDGSVLWLLEAQPQASHNLRRESERRGIDSNRLIFAPLRPHAEHLARQTCADLFLDSFPCNAHTTASDALWSGVPVLTRMGETFASRVAASLLSAVDLPELITTTPVAYEDLAVALALDLPRLLALRNKLDRNRFNTTLFDAASYARNLENAYTIMVQRSRDGLPAQHIDL